MCDAFALSDFYLAVFRGYVYKYQINSRLDNCNKKLRNSEISNAGSEKWSMLNYISVFYFIFVIHY